MNIFGKKDIVLDFDGVLHSYTSKWMEADFIPDPPVPGAIKFLKDLIYSKEYNVCIFSSRSHQDGGIRAMKNWIKFWCLKELTLEEANGVTNYLFDYNSLTKKFEHFPVSKPSAFLSIDDRAMCFTGTFPSFEEINAFKPWNKK